MHKKNIKESNIIDELYVFSEKLRITRTFCFVFSIVKTQNTFTSDKEFFLNYYISKYANAKLVLGKSC